MSIYTDSGSFGNLAAGILVKREIGYPFSWPNNGTTKEYALTYQQFANAVSDPSYGATDGNAPSAYLSAKTPLVQKGAGVVEFTRVYTQVPTDWNEKQIVAYTFPGLSGYSGPNWSPYFYRSPVTLYCVANVSHQFSQGVSSPIPASPFLVTDQSNVVDYIGVSNPNLGGVLTNPAAEPTNYIVNGEIHLVRPTIWENVTIQVPKPV